MLLTLAALAADAPPPAPAPAVSPDKLLALPNPRGLAMDKDGNLYVGDVSDGAVYKMNQKGEGAALGTTGANAPTIGTPTGVAVDKDGNVYVADADSNTIRKISPDGKVTTLAGQDGQSGSTDGPGATARFNGATALAVDLKGNIIVADTHNNLVRKITPDGVVSTLGGKPGTDEAKTVNGKGSEVRFGQPRGVAIDAAGNIYIADELFGTVRKIAPDGTTTTLAGDATASGATSKDGIGTRAVIATPRGIAVDRLGNVYVADTDSSAIRKISPDGAVSTVAGKIGEAGFTDGQGDAARFSGPRGIVVDWDGNLYVADSDNGAIRKITQSRIVTTIGGTKPPSPAKP
jgi:sugar lactone lactonase YvrE